MRAVAIRRTGPPESLEIADIPMPSPGPGEVRIRVRRAGINFAGVLARQGVPPDAHRLLQERSTIGKVLLVSE